MLMGEYRHNIDTKGRMIVPSKLREELGEEFVLTQRIRWLSFWLSHERMEESRS